MTTIHPSSGAEMDEHNTDSPQRGEPVFLVIGRFRHSHGINGEIAMEIYTDFPERIRPQATIYAGETHQLLKIKTVRRKNELMLLSFEGFSTSDQVNVFRNQFAYTATDKLPSLPEGQYYHYQILGLEVRDISGKLLGNLKEIIQTGANDVYVVRSEDGSEVLLPAVEEVVIHVDLDQKTMVVKPQEWS